MNKEYDPNRIYVRLPLENSGNIRDLGGYPARDFKTTRFKRFLRAGTLAYLTEPEIRFLLDYGVKTVIDLRTEGEAGNEVTPFRDIPGVGYTLIPFLVGDITSYPYEQNNLNAMSDMYIHILDVCAENVVKAIRTIASAEEGTILYHCSAGKDRTGVLSYILLALCGVDETDIIANYQITETYYLPLFRKYTPNYNKIPMQYLRSQAENMERTIGFVEDRYGGVEEYLIQNGVSAGELDKVRERLLD